MGNVPKRFTKKQNIYDTDIHMKYTINRSKLNGRQAGYIVNRIEGLDFAPTPYMGTYSEVIYNQTNPSMDSKLLKAVSAITDMLGVEQDFNTVIVKRFEVGNYVIPHRDSRNTVGQAITMVLGDNAQFRFDGNLEDVSSGDIIIQECTNGYSMGPEYSVKPLQDGVMYTITLCTILKENPV